MTMDEAYEKYAKAREKLDKEYNQAILDLSKILREDLKVIREGCKTNER